MSGIFDKFEKITLNENGVLLNIYYDNDKIFDYYNNMTGDFINDKLLDSANILSEKLGKIIKKLKIENWTIKKDSFKIRHYYEQNVCRILLNSGYLIDKDSYYCASEELKEIIK